VELGPRPGRQTTPNRPERQRHALPNPHSGLRNAGSKPASTLSVAGLQPGCQEVAGSNPVAPGLTSARPQGSVRTSGHPTCPGKPCGITGRRVWASITNPSGTSADAIAGPRSRWPASAGQQTLARRLGRSDLDAGRLCKRASQSMKDSPHCMDYIVGVYQAPRLGRTPVGGPALARTEVPALPDRGWRSRLGSTCPGRGTCGRAPSGRRGPG
jgi:hypothetical protein